MLSGEVEYGDREIGTTASRLWDSTHLGRGILTTEGVKNALLHVACYMELNNYLRRRCR